MVGDLPAASISKWTGLYRSVDPSSIAPGAMARADNVVVPGPSLLRPRRGYKPATSAALRSVVTSLGFYGQDIVFTDDANLQPPAYTAQDATTLGTSFGVFRNASDFKLTGASLSSYGFAVPASTARNRWFTTTGNLYLTTGFGLARTASPPAALAAQGWDVAGLATPPIPVAPPGSFVPVTGSFLANGSQVGYRATWRYTDSNGNVHRSAPCAKVVVNNTQGSARDVAYNYELGSMVPVGTILELWRTATTPIPSNGGDATGDECFKVAEIAPTNVSVGANGFLTYTGPNPAVSGTDSTPDTPFLVEPLYTNPTTGAVNGLGIGNANVPPPAATDVFTFKGRTYFLNTQEVQRLTVQIIGTGTGGIVDGDTFTCGGVAFQWKDSAAAAAGFQRVQLWRTGGTQDAGSIAANLYQSARACAVAINGVLNEYSNFVNFPSAGIQPGDLASQLWAEAVFVNGLGGYVNLARLAPGALPFSVTAGVGAGRGWAGSLASRNTSDPNRQPANMMQSQANDPESVPPAFTRTVGRLDRPILRGLGLRDASYIFKGQGDGLWKFTDDGTGNIVLSPVDQTVNLVAPETLVSLDNAIFCLTDKGVAKIADGGAPELVSTDKVQDDLADLVAYVGAATLASVAFAVAYESEKLYILCLPESPNATTCTVQYVYNLQSEAWTRWTLPDVTCGGVNPLNDHLYFGRRTTASGGNILWEERKALDDSDYQDPGFTSTVPSGTGFTSLLKILPGGPTAAQIATGALAGVTCSRAASAYCRTGNPAQPLVLLGPNTVRVEPEGLLREGPATNAALWSEDFTNPVWTLQGNGVAAPIVTNSTDVPPPFGSVLVNKCVFPAVAPGQYSILFQLAANRTQSIWLRTLTGTATVSLISYSGNVAQVCHVTTTWQRFVFAGEGVNAYVALGFDCLTTGGLNPPTAGCTVYATAFQSELTPGFASSYIPTTTVQVTRDADLLSFTNPLPATPPAWAVGLTATPQGPWKDINGPVNTAAGLMNCPGVWALSREDSTAPAFTANDIKFSATGAGGTAAVIVPGLASGASAVSVVGENANGVAATSPAGNPPTGSGPGLSTQGATIYLGAIDAVGTSPFSGWFKDINIGTGVPSPASSLVFPGNVTGSYAPGDLIQYSPDSSHSYLVRVTGATWDPIGNTTTVTLAQTVAFNPGDPFTVIKGIQCRLGLLPLTAGAGPLYEKQWQNLYLYFRRATFASVDVSFSTEKQQNPVTYPLAGPVGAPWLYDQTLGFGLVPWGGTAQDVILKLALDQAAARSAELTLGFRLGDALASWELSAIRIPYDPSTMRVVR